MLRHLLPAWLPLLLLITFLGCQSLEKKSQKSTDPKIQVVTTCPSSSKKIDYLKEEKLLICGKLIYQNKKESLFRSFSLLREREKSKYELVYQAQNFQTFRWKKESLKRLEEILLVKVNTRSKILKIQSLVFNCSHISCLQQTYFCDTEAVQNLFPNISYRVKYLNKNIFSNELSDLLLQQLVWQSLNGDVLAQSILLRYNEWFRLNEHTSKKFEYYKLVVAKTTKNVCIQKGKFIVNNF